MTQAADAWLLTPQRVAIHRPTRTGVVADLHLGYAQARQRGGEAVPLPDLARLLAPLALARDGGADRLVIAGDLFEVPFHDTLAGAFLGWLAEQKIQLIAVVPGNHDRGWRGSDTFPIHEEGFRLGDWYIVHGDKGRGRGAVVQGHVHPCLRWQGHAAPCYLVGADHLVLPAYSVEAAGVNVLDDPAWAGYECLAVVGEEVLSFGRLGKRFIAPGLEGSPPLDGGR